MLAAGFNVYCSSAPWLAGVIDVVGKGVAFTEPSLPGLLGCNLTRIQREVGPVAEFPLPVVGGVFEA